MFKKKGRTGCFACIGILLTLLAWLQYRPAVPWSYQPLFEAARAGDAKQVEALLQNGLDPNFQERLPLIQTHHGRFGRMSPLHLAALSGDPETVEVLLKYGANPNIRTDIAGNAPLDYVARGAAAAAQHEQSLKYAMSRTGRTDTLTESPGAAAAHVRAERPQQKLAHSKFAETAKLLIDAGASAAEMQSQGAVAMRDVAISGDHGLLEQFLRLDFGDMNSEVMLSGMLSAGWWQRSDMFNALADHADAKALSKCLDRASHEGNLPLMTELLDRGADPNIITDRGTTSLYSAALQGHVDAVRLLLARGAKTDVGVPREYGRREYAIDVAKDPEIRKLLSDNAPTPQASHANPNAPRR